MASQTMSKILKGKKKIRDVIANIISHNMEITEGGFIWDIK